MIAAILLIAYGLKIVANSSAAKLRHLEKSIKVSAFLLLFHFLIFSPGMAVSSFPMIACGCEYESLVEWICRKKNSFLFYWNTAKWWMTGMDILHFLLRKYGFVFLSKIKKEKNKENPKAKNLLSCQLIVQVIFLFIFTLTLVT